MSIQLSAWLSNRLRNAELQAHGDALRKNLRALPFSAEKRAICAALEGLGMLAPTVNPKAPNDN